MPPDWLCAGERFVPDPGLQHQDGLTQTTTIRVNLNGLDTDSTLQDVATQLNQVSGVSATINSQGQLTIQSTGPDQQIAFGQDTSGFLAAIGINTFFSGTSALNLGVSQSVVSDPSKFAASQGGVGADTDNALQLAGFLNTPLASQNGDSLSDLHANLVNQTSQAASVSSFQCGRRRHAPGVAEEPEHRPSAASASTKRRSICLPFSGPTRLRPSSSR